MKVTLENIEKFHYALDYFYRFSNIAEFIRRIIRI